MHQLTIFEIHQLKNKIKAGQNKIEENRDSDELKKTHHSHPQ